jgi:hypothetical protein
VEETVFSPAMQKKLILSYTVLGEGVLEVYVIKIPFIYCRGRGRIRGIRQKKDLPCRAWKM